MDLIRELLLRFESGDQTPPAGKTQEIVAYHVEQMIAAGLVTGTIARRSVRGQKVPHFYHVNDITPAGHDFIAALRDDKFWTKLKKHFETQGAPITLELLVQGAKRLGRELLGLSE
jgi:hypothetical protein